MFEKIKVHTEETAGNTRKLFVDHEAIYLSIAALLVAVVTLGFTIKTTRSQKRTEHNTRKKSPEQESQDLQALTRCLLDTYRKLLKVIKRRDSALASMIPTPSLLEGMKISPERFYSDECVNVTWRNQQRFTELVHELLQHCLGFNETIDERVTTLEEFEIDYASHDNQSVRNLGYGDMLGKLVNIIDTIREVDLSMWDRQPRRKSEVSRAYEKLYTDCGKEATASDEEMRSYWSRSGDDVQKGGGWYFSEEADFKQFLQGERGFSRLEGLDSVLRRIAFAEMQPDEGVHIGATAELLEYSYNPLSRPAFLLETHADCALGFVSTVRFEAARSIPSMLYSSASGGTIMKHELDLSLFQSYLSGGTAVIPIPLSDINRIDLRHTLEDYLRDIAGIKHLPNPKLPPITAAPAFDQQTAQRLMPVRHVVLTYVSRLFVYEASFDVTPSLEYGHLELFHMLAEKDAAKKNRLYFDTFCPTVVLRCHIDRLASFTKQVR